MYSYTKPKILPGDKLIIGLGDSFTQGIGAYLDSTWKKYDGKIPISTTEPEIIMEQYAGSWVNQLSVLMPGYKPVNLGHAGTGNRAAVKQLYFWNHLGLDKASEAVVILMLSGAERFDFINKDLTDTHNNFLAMWPNPHDPKASHKELWDRYARDIYSEKFAVAETLLNIIEAQEWAKSRGYKFIVASAFDSRFTRQAMEKTFRGGVLKKESEHGLRLLELIDWDCFFYPRECNSFIELLLDLEGNRNMSMGTFYRHYTGLDYPSKYITTCAHPTLLGHTVIANELFKVINGNNRS